VEVEERGAKIGLPGLKNRPIWNVKIPVRSRKITMNTYATGVAK
jgi:hypothetical protein